MDQLAKQQACQLLIEQEIETGLAQGKSKYSIGKELSAWVEKLFNAKISPHTIEVRAHRTEEKLLTNVSKPHVAHNTGENEWYTPPEYIEAARKVMGKIDLDPASSDKANKIVKAKESYTKEDSGLDKEWTGNVWMNPPYSSELIKQFSSKFSQHIKKTDINQGIVLVNNATETAWFRELVDCAQAVIFTSGRVKFLDPDGNPGAPLQGQAIIYFGDNQDVFFKEFGKFGWGAIIHG